MKTIPFSSEIENNLLRFIDKTSDWIIILDKNCNVEYFNPIVEKYLQIKRKDLIGKNFWESTPSMIDKRICQECDRVQQTQKKRKFEFFFKDLHKWFLVNIYPSENSVVLYLTNTDKQKNAEKEMKKSNIFLKSVIEQMPVGVVVAEAPEGKIIIGNQELEKIFKFPLKNISRIEEYETLEAYHVKSGQRYQPQEWPLARSLLKGEFVNWEEAKIMKGDGSMGYIRIRSAPIKNKAGQIIAGVAIDHDITDIKEIERKKDEFISMASHELKTPITTIKVFSQILRKSAAKSDYKNTSIYLEKMECQINKLDKLVGELLDVSRIQVGNFHLKKRYFSLNKLIKEVTGTINTANPSHKIIIKNIDKIIIYGDKDRIGEVLINLLINAIKYSPSTPEININIQKNNTYAVVDVVDYGIGIGKEHYAKIFQRLYRVYDKNDKTFPGLGIGLYIASEIIKLHKGTMSVESKPGEGSTFTFTLPLTKKSLN